MLDEGLVVLVDVVGKDVELEVEEVLEARRGRRRAGTGSSR